VPIGVAALLLAPRLVPESRLEAVRRRFDPLGAVTVTGGPLLLVYALSKAPEVGWGAARTVTLLAVSAALRVKANPVRSGCGELALAQGVEGAFADLSTRKPPVVSGVAAGVPAAVHRTVAGLRSD